VLSVNDLFGLACCLTKAWRFIWKTRGKSKDFLTFFSFLFSCETKWLLDQVFEKNYSSKILVTILSS
jgi:hypothetical protein